MTSLEGLALYRADAVPHESELYVDIERLRIDLAVDDVVQSRELGRARIVIEGELRHVDRVWASLHGTIKSIHEGSDPEQALDLEIGRLRGVLSRVLMGSLLEIRRAAFSAPIGSRYTEAIRSEIANECARLEGTIRDALK